MVAVGLDGGGETGSDGREIKQTHSGLFKQKKQRGREELSTVRSSATSPQQPLTPLTLSFIMQMGGAAESFSPSNLYAIIISVSLSVLLSLFFWRRCCMRSRDWRQ